MENGEPQMNSIDASIDGGKISVSANATATRNCSQCSKELTSLDQSFKSKLELKDFPKFKDLSEIDKAKFQAALDAGTLDLDADASDGEMEESGGGRKNMITTNFSYQVKAKVGYLEIIYEGKFTIENADSEFEECC
jgi:hypothetical protein